MERLVTILDYGAGNIASLKSAFEYVGARAEIAKTKDADLTAADMDAAVRTIAGTARSMGLNVEGVE